MGHSKYYNEWGKWRVGLPCRCSYAGLESSAPPTRAGTRRGVGCALAAPAEWKIRWEEEAVEGRIGEGGPSMSPSAEDCRGGGDTSRERDRGGGERRGREREREDVWRDGASASPVWEAADGRRGRAPRRR
jgi:hypothetical protein